MNVGVGVGVSLGVSLVDADGVNVVVADNVHDVVATADSLGDGDTLPLAESASALHAP